MVRKASTGLQGFKGEAEFDALHIPEYMGSSATIIGGGAIVKRVKIDGFTIPEDKGGDITFHLLRDKEVNSPMIRVETRTRINLGDAFDPLLGLTATDVEDGDLLAYVTVEGAVDTNTSGVYYLTYSVRDSDGNLSSIVRKVIVSGNDKPVFTGTADTSIFIGKTIDLLLGVRVTDTEDGDLTKNMVVTGSVNTAVVGIYPITYSVTDSDDNTTTVIRNIRVKTNTKPVFSGIVDTSVKLGGPFDPLLGVTAMDEEDGDITAKIVVKNTCDVNVLGRSTVEYSVTDSDGNTVRGWRTVIVRSNELPVIAFTYASIVYLGDTFDPKEDVYAYDYEDGDITDTITITGYVNTKAVGAYPVTFSVTDSDGNTVSKEKIYYVRTNTNPVIRGADKVTIKVGSKFNPMAGVTAVDKEDGDITTAINSTGSVNTTKAGTYVLQYSVTDSDGNLVQQKRYVVVRTNTKPQIKGAKNQTIRAGSKFDKIKGVSASDTEDGNLTSKIKITGTVNTTKPGSYVLTYSLADSDGNTVQVKRTITVQGTFKTLTINVIDNTHTILTGKGQVGATVQAYVGSKAVSKRVTVNAKGTYKLIVPKQKGGAVIKVLMTKAYYLSMEKKTTVLRTFGTFTVNNKTTKDSYIKGKCLSGATVKVYINGKQVGKTTKASSKGQYSIKVGRHKKGTKIVVKVSKGNYRGMEKSITVKS